MIRELRLTNFKCFRREHVPLERLTLLAGVNGAGKSSVVQALLTLRQICLRGAFSNSKVSLSGDLVDLGRAVDILFTSADEDKISLELKADGYPTLVAIWRVDIESAEAFWSEPDIIQEALRSMASGGMALFNGAPSSTPQVAGFNYLSAERFGPRKALPIEGAQGSHFDLGSHGEYVFDALLSHQDQIKLPASDPRSLPDASGDRLRDQLEMWLAEITPGVRLNITGVTKADLAVGAFSFGHEGELRSPEYRPTNVGFGLSYVLPVLAALLAAPEDALVIIENPEAHLHPRGQTRLGELCARAAAAGVQVVVETHSDHVLDGARLMVKNRVLSRDAANFHYFQYTQGSVVRQSPVVDEDGRLSEWPEGFFDQHRRNAASLARRR